MFRVLGIYNFAAYTINCVCHSIRSMFRVLGIYNLACALTRSTTMIIPQKKSILKSLSASGEKSHAFFASIYFWVDIISVATPIILKKCQIYYCSSRKEFTSWCFDNKVLKIILLGLSPFFFCKSVTTQAKIFSSPGAMLAISYGWLNFRFPL